MRRRIYPPFRRAAPTTARHRPSRRLPSPARGRRLLRLRPPGRRSGAPRAAGRRCRGGPGPRPGL